MSFYFIEKRQIRNDLFVLILGTGRSGTTYIHQVLHESGLDFQHENLGKDGGIGFNLVWYLEQNHICPKNIKILHIIREPLSCIGSITTFTKKHWDKHKKRKEEFQYDYENKIRRAMQYYLHWNKRCYKLSHCTFRLEEDLYKTYLNKIFRKDFKWENQPEDTNTRKHQDLSWEDLRSTDVELTEEIQEFYRTLPIVGSP